jgi:hypothetical protein
MLIVLDDKLKPTLLRDYTVKEYVLPGVSGTVVV